MMSFRSNSAMVGSALVYLVAGTVVGGATPLGVAAAFGQSPRFDLSPDVTLDEVDSVTRGHLERARVLAVNKRWDEVIETLRQVTDARGDRVIFVGAGNYVRLRDYCHRRLASLPPEALALYREQVDPQAEEWFTAASATRDERRLRAIIDQFYCSSRGDDALRLLGEIALERGDYGAARGYWEQLVESPPATIGVDEFTAVRGDATLTADERTLLDRYYARRDQAKFYELRPLRSVDPDLLRLATALRTHGVVGLRLAYPHAGLSPADVFARLIWVNILEGSHVWAAAGVKDLAAAYPDARGRLAGRETNYVEGLQTLLDDSRTWPRLDRGADWPTFAGNGARNRVQPVEFDVGRVKWRAAWQPISASEEYFFPARRPAEEKKALLSYVPIVVGRNVFVTDGQVIRGYDLETGGAAWSDDPVVYRPDVDKPLLEPSFSPQRSTVGVPRFTLSAHRNRLYARLGPPVTAAALGDGLSRHPTSRLICLDLEKEGSALWGPITPPEDRMEFEGPPIADDEHVYVALRKGGVRPQVHVACLDAATGAYVWRRMICSAESYAKGDHDEITHNLLTLVGDALYLNTNLGAVAALSKHDGEIRWITTYPRASGEELNQRTAHFFRDLTPCLYDRGTVIVAPGDSRHILAFDAACGLLLWETSLPDDVVHLLGVSGDSLFASGDRLWWINSLSGRVEHVWPDESPKGYGRGAPVGDAVLRPTRTTLEVLGVGDRERRREIELSTRDAQGGHVIVVDDYVLIAAADELIVFDRHSGPQARPAAGVRADTKPSSLTVRAPSFIPVEVQRQP